MRKLSKYSIWAFGSAWILQSAAGLSMFTPMLAAAISRPGLWHLGWKPYIKKNWRWILAAWFVPLLLGTLGAAIYFLIIPGAWDTSLSYAYQSLGAEGVQQLKNSGLPLILVAIAICIHSYNGHNKAGGNR